MFIQSVKPLLRIGGFGYMPVMSARIPTLIDSGASEAGRHPGAHASSVPTLAATQAGGRGRAGHLEDGLTRLMRAEERTMIARVWRGRSAPTNAEAYGAFLRRTAFPDYGG